METNYQTVSDLLNELDRKYACGCSIHLLVPDQAIFSVNFHDAATLEHQQDFVLKVTESLKTELLANRFMSRNNA